MLEIYNEKLRDLLDPASSGGPGLKLKENKVCNVYALTHLQHQPTPRPCAQCSENARPIHMCERATAETHGEWTAALMGYAHISCTRCMHTSAVTSLNRVNLLRFGVGQLVGFYVESLSHFVVNSEEGVMRLLAMGTQVFMPNITEMHPHAMLAFAVLGSGCKRMRPTFEALRQSRIPLWELSSCVFVCLLQGRTIRSTNMNDTSSRAHTIFTISLEQVRSVVPMRVAFLAAMALSFVLGSLRSFLCAMKACSACQVSKVQVADKQVGGIHSWHIRTPQHACSREHLQLPASLASLHWRTCNRVSAPRRQTSPYRFSAAYRFF
jgi:hypothetical protein